MQLVTPARMLGQVGGWLQTVMVSGQLIGLIITPLLVPGRVAWMCFFAEVVFFMVILILFLAAQLFGKGGMKPDPSLC